MEPLKKTEKLLSTSKYKYSTGTVPFTQAPGSSPNSPFSASQRLNCTGSRGSRFPTQSQLPVYRAPYAPCAIIANNNLRGPLVGYILLYSIWYCSECGSTAHVHNVIDESPYYVTAYKGINNDGINQWTTRRQRLSSYARSPRQFPSTPWAFP